MVTEDDVAAAETALLDAEVALATSRAELENFAGMHHTVLGPLYERLDELDALIAEATAALSGSREDIKAAYAARAHVDELPAFEELLGEVGPDEPERLRPGKDAQKLYRELARKVHPDLAQDPVEKERRGAFIVRVNEAYRLADLTSLRALADEWAADAALSDAPEVGSPEREPWLARRLAWLKRRTSEIEAEYLELLASPLAGLLETAPGQPSLVLELLAEQLIEGIRAKEKELEALLG